MKLAILGSTRGTALLSLIEAIKQKQLTADITVVISNKANALILECAKEYGLQTQFIDPTGLSREQYDRKMSLLLRQHAIEVIVLIGYMRILSDEFVTSWENKIINTHPSLLPAFAGLMDLEVHRAVLAAGVKQTGCTVHQVTKEVDGGPILLQKTCPVLAEDTPESLKKRVQALESMALVEVLTRWV